jgi:hypothetical protein
VGRCVAAVPGSREVTKHIFNRTLLESWTIAGDSPVGEKDMSS